MKLVLTEEIQERELCAQGEVLVRCRCMLPKLQPLPPRAQRRLERCLTELDPRWNRACEGWLLEQAAEGAQLARRNALPFAPLEAVLDFETTLLDERFWSVRWSCCGSGDRCGMWSAGCCAGWNSFCRSSGKHGGTFGGS